jgi:hypothetical protein
MDRPCKLRLQVNPVLGGPRWDGAQRALDSGVRMAFTTQAEAKRFLVSRVAEQAAREGLGLSGAERHMLSWSESDPDFTPQPELVEALSSEMSDEQYEAKVSGLLRRAFDVAGELEQSLFREAQAKLKEGDHYILVMAEGAIPSGSKPWWRLW